MSQTSGVLIIGPNQSVDFGADSVASFAQAEAYLESRKPSVVVFGQDRARAGSPGGALDAFCEKLLAKSPHSLWIFAADGLAPSQITRWNNAGRLFDLIDDLGDAELEKKLRGALEAAGQEEQTRALTGMVAEQGRQLMRLQSELESRVGKRHRTLRKSLRNLEQTKQRLEAFHGALLGIHRASSVPQMEQTLNEALGHVLGLAWVRVRFSQQSLLGRKADSGVLAIEIPFAGQALRGEALFAKPEGKRFRPEEVDFLQELSDALGLALSRLHKLDEAETLKAQWQATFDSIPHPLCLTTGDFEILKLNRAFRQACPSETFRTLIGKNAFAAFFAGDFQPPRGMAVPFTFRNARTGPQQTEHYEVIGEPLGVAQDSRPVNLILLRPITDEVRFERRIVAASKLAELGTIGSSIAHELNNPLGGMLSFLQLILMDLKPGDMIYDDVRGMEHAVLRCRDIVLNLLSFSRKQDLGDFVPVDLEAVIGRSIKLIELQSKSKGIRVVADPLAPGDGLVLGSANALSQALCNLLQNAIEAIGDRLRDEPLFPGRIDVSLRATGEQIQLRVIDNGPGIRPEIQNQIFNPLFTTRDPAQHHGMGLTTAFTIVNEHQGTLEILSQTGSGSTAIVALPRYRTRD